MSGFPYASKICYAAVVNIISLWLQWLVGRLNAFEDHGFLGAVTEENLEMVNYVKSPIWYPIHYPALQLWLCEEQNCA